MTPISNAQKSLKDNGFTVQEELCPPALIEDLHKICSSQLEEKLESLKGKKIGIGSAAGFKEICQRSPGRWDIPIDLKEMGIEYNKTPWWPIVAEVLGEDATCCFQGLVSSEPHTPDQEWHIDSPHTQKEHSAPNIINVLVALQDIPMEMGPTQVAAGTHKFTNHFVNPNLVIDELVYQCDKTQPETLLTPNSPEKFETWTAPMKAGTVLFFDDRVLHRGQANQSEHIRHVAYFSYKRKGYEQNTYFETEKSLNT